MPRKIFFWMHLCAGAIAGIVILIMSVTGVLLMYERQILAWADSGFRSSASGPRLPIEELIAVVNRDRGAPPSIVTLRANLDAPMEAVFGRGAPVYVDVYTGQVLGQGSTKLRAFFQTVTDWHRWLGAQGAKRPVGRAITGACNLAFLLLVMSGFYLWLPRQWSWPRIRPVVWFRRGLKGKARDFNWHNTIGLWCAVPLFFIVIGASVISYPWATNLVYRLAGNEPPARPAGAPAEVSGRGVANLEGLNRVWAAAEQQIGGWQSIMLRLPAGDATQLSFTIDQAHRGRPDKRFLITLDRQTGQVVRRDEYAAYNTGRKIRTWLRWIHTGEAGGPVGQTIAGVASAGGAVLVWTGLALAWRRFRAWRSRSSSRAVQQASLQT